jgi:hypothetical protein
MDSDQIERCKREIAAIEAELLAGNTDVPGLLLALSDWHCEWRLLEAEQREGRPHEDPQQDRTPGGGASTAASCVSLAYPHSLR